jgi:septum formation protein
MNSLRPSTLLPYLKKLQSDYKVILASGSPRRKELLSLMGITDFEVLVSNFPENLEYSQFKTPQDYCLATATQKVQAVANLVSNRVGENIIVIGADTIVSIDGNILEKPMDYADAKRMISSLSGRTHTVFTSVVIFSNAFEGDRKDMVLKRSFVESTDVRFADLSESDIDAYVASGEGLDKAGSYGIQALGGQLVESINGCYFNVMGLPVNKLSKGLADLFQLS